MDKSTVFQALNAVPGMTPRVFWRMVRGLHRPDRIFSMTIDKVTSMGFTAKMAQGLREIDPEQTAERESHKIREMGGRIVIHGDPEYPPSLTQIPDPPPVLYVLGELKQEDRIALAIVGSRAASTQGRLNAERISAELAGRGVTIVSGLAIGVDTWAHKGALMAGGRTIAVLGCGLDVPYPKYNRDLRRRIHEHGALVSEFPLGTPPLPMNFPRRNRIISGISLGTLVVEAAQKSGSLITANFALDQGRDVFAVPGSIYSPLSSGVNTLIQKGAKLVQGVDDILEEFSPEIRDYLRLQEKRTDEPKMRGSRSETLILNLIRKEPVHIDELTSMASMAPEAVSSLLMKLELKGRVRQLPGKLYTRP